jgi:hypothetical protein
MTLQATGHGPTRVDCCSNMQDVNLGVFDVNGKPRGDLGPEIDLPEQQENEDMDQDSDDSEDVRTTVHTRRTMSCSL